MEWRGKGKNIHGRRDAAQWSVGRWAFPLHYRTASVCPNNPPGHGLLWLAQTAHLDIAYSDSLGWAPPALSSQGPSVIPAKPRCAASLSAKGITPTLPSVALQCKKPGTCRAQLCVYAYGRKVGASGKTQTSGLGAIFMYKYSLFTTNVLLAGI